MPRQATREADVLEVVWERLSGLLAQGKRGGRPLVYDRRRILEAIMYLMRTECGWEHLPKDFPPWKTVHWHLTKWRKSGIWDTSWAGLALPGPSS